MTPHNPRQVALQLASVNKESHINDRKQGDLVTINTTYYWDCIKVIHKFCHCLGAAAKGGKWIVETAL